MNSQLISSGSPAGTRTVPNIFPTEPTERRIAVIGEAPGRLEDAYGKPFVGPAGKMLGHILKEVGLRREQVFIGNLCQTKPLDDHLNNFDPNGPERTEGLRQLRDDLQSFRPEITILLGGEPLKATGQRVGVSSYRGTVFRCTDSNSPFAGLKCISTYHPASLLHGGYTNLPIIIADFRRGVEEAKTPDVGQTTKRYLLDLTALEIVDRLDEISRSPGSVLVSFDIEGGVTRLPCCSISTNSDEAFVIAFEDKSRADGSRFSLDEEILVWTSLSRLLSDPLVRKCLQNSLYDRFVLAYRYRILIRNVSEDTMLKHWELFCEFDKDLGFQVSYYTNEPYYKSERKSDTQRDFWTYCCKDSAHTHEICRTQEPLLDDRNLPYAREHYRFNMALLDPFLYMELRGIRYDSALARTKVAKLEAELFSLQHSINVAILGPDYLSPQRVIDNVCIKRRENISQGSDILRWARKAYAPVVGRIGSLLDASVQRTLTDAEKGELSLLSDAHFNCESSQQKVNYLYNVRGFDPMTDRKTGSPTANYEALLSIAKKTDDPVVLALIRATSLLTNIQMLRIKADPDGRVRCAYNAVGTNTGRITCYTSPTGSGYNLQTIPQNDRDLYLADVGKYFFQCDLAGADAWTVACWCKRMGDPAMLDDLLAGIKIAKVVALMFLQGPHISDLPRAELRIACNAVKKEDPIYFGSKCVQHATNYDAKEVTISATIFTQSEGQVNVPTKDCRVLQAYYNRRYPGLQRYKNFAANQLLNVGRITAASGHTRIFYGNRRDHHVFKQFLAFEPQANTTCATNMAALRLWKDPLNRTEDGRLIVEPLHQVHDALCGQFPQQDAETYGERVGSYFDNPLCIASTTVVIPFEGGYGPSWKDLSKGTIVPRRIV